VAATPTEAAIFLHGGAGSGCTPGARRYFDPAAYRVVLSDQRGSGRSWPLASGPGVDLNTNATAHLIADIDKLCDHHHGIDRWTVLGVSWGTTLGLAYAQAHRCTSGSRTHRSYPPATSDVFFGCVIHADAEGGAERTVVGNTRRDGGYCSRTV
jgi:hypothetical protein